MGLSVEDEVRCPKSGYSIDILVQALENRGAGSWLMHKHQGSLREVFQHRRQDLIYLSPDGQETLERLTPGKVYVIGGIVDRTVSKGLSLKQSRGSSPDHFAIPAMRLPIDEHIPRSFQVSI